VNAKPLGTLQPLPIPPFKWHTVTLDLVTGLPTTSAGFDACVVFVDKLSKMLHFAPCTKSVDAPGVAQLFFDNVFRYHGLPTVLVSDRDPRFTSHFWRTLFKLCGTKLSMSSAYHAQTDGQTERANRTLEEALRAYVSSRHDDWDKHLTAVEFAYNNSVNASTGYTPFYLNYALHPATPAALTSGTTVVTSCPTVDQFVETLRTVMLHARDNLVAAQQSQKRHADTRRRPASFAVGDRVYLSTANLDLRPSHKLQPRWIGPFAIKRVVNPVAFELDLPTQYRRIHPIFHSSLLRSHKPSDPAVFPARSQVTRPLPEIGTTDRYIVEDILDSCMMRAANGRLVKKWLVQWRDCPASDNTWEPASNLRPPAAGSDVWDMVQAFETRRR